MNGNQLQLPGRRAVAGCRGDHLLRRVLLYHGHDARKAILYASYCCDKQTATKEIRARSLSWPCNQEAQTGEHTLRRLHHTATGAFHYAFNQAVPDVADCSRRFTNA